MVDVDKVIRFEDGDLTEDETVAFFQELLDTGGIYRLQGSYQRTMKHFIENGLVIPKTGEPLDSGKEA